LVHDGYNSAGAARRIGHPIGEHVMERRAFVVSSVLGTVGLGTGHRTAADAHAAAAGSLPGAHTAAATRRILIAGGGFNTAFIRYMAALTGKPRPRLCYPPDRADDMPGRAPTLAAPATGH
jgi:hypothetical protein